MPPGTGREALQSHHRKKQHPKKLKGTLKTFAASGTAPEFDRDRYSVYVVNNSASKWAVVGWNTEGDGSPWTLIVPPVENDGDLHKIGDWDCNDEPFDIYFVVLLNDEYRSSAPRRVRPRCSEAGSSIEIRVD
jgi:hypothetical protein